MKLDIDWGSIETVLLGLHFDNYFWQHYLPLYWRQLNNMSADAAKAQLNLWYAKETVTLAWYCLYFRTERLNFDVFKLKDLAR